MGQFVQAILDNLHKLWPYRIIDADSQGMRFSKGKVTLLHPGGHWFCPGLQRIEAHGVLYQEIDCKLQSVETRDGVGVTFSANVGYEIIDLALLRVSVHDFDTTLERMTRGNLAESVADSDFASTKAARKTMVSAARKKLKDYTDGWGVKIVRVRLTDFVRSEMQRRFISTDQ